MDYEDTDFVTIGEIMEKLSVCRNTVYTLLKRKEIDSYKWANSGIDESRPAAVKAGEEGHNMAKTAGKEEMGKG